MGFKIRIEKKDIKKERSNFHKPIRVFKNVKKYDRKKGKKEMREDY